jgi:hypothetical protein
MREYVPPSQSKFIPSFDVVESVVCDSGKYFMAHPAQDRDSRGQIPPNYVIIEAETTPGKRYKPPYGNASFSRWETNSPTDKQDFATFADLPDEDRIGWASKALFVGDSFYTRSWFAGEWSRYVRSESDMARLLRYVFDQNVRGGFEPGQALQFGNLTQSIVVQSLQYASQPNASIMTGSIHESVATTPPRRGQEIIAKIYPSLGKALLRAPLQIPTASSALRELSGAEIVQGVELYDRAGLVDDKFWVSFGVDAAATIVTPEFTPLLANKLAAPDGEGERLIREHVPYRQRTARAYITKVLRAYSDDPNRSQRNATNILNATLPGKQPDITVDLDNLIAEANRISPAQNKYTEERGEIGEGFVAFPHEQTFVSDAFLRLLGMTKLTAATQEMQIAQWEQDIYHADIIGAILGHGGATEISDADVTLQFPGLDERQRQLIRRMMRGSAGELLRALQKQKAQRRTEPKHPSPGEEGHPHPRY